jgi:uncharacterized protein (TIGR03000 family)
MRRFSGLFTACAILVSASPAFSQVFNVGFLGSQTIVRPPSYAVGFGTYNPNYSSPVFVPGVGYAYYPENTGLRPSYWSLPGRYSAYPWSGAGVYTGGTGVYAYYWPTFYNSSSLDVGYASPYSAGLTGYGPLGGSPYGGESYASGMLYQAPVAAGAYRSAIPVNALPVPPSDRAVLSVQVPAGAILSVEGADTKQTGTDRVFVSPPLKPGQDYAYTVKAQWKVNDKAVEQTQKVTVRAGERSALLFISGDVAKAK